MKKCSKCKLIKPLTEFTKSKFEKLGVHHYCKYCHSQQRKDTYNYNKSKSANIMRKYKLSLDDVKKMSDSQYNKCKICNIKYENVSKHNGLYIDHCHKSGKVRGLLCAKCNRLLGVWDDNIEILQSAIDYLKKH